MIQRTDTVGAKANHLRVLLYWNKTKLNWQALDFELQQMVERQCTTKNKNWVIPVAMKEKVCYCDVATICDEAPDSTDAQQLRQTITALKEQYEWILCLFYGRYGRIVGIQISEDAGIVRPIMCGRSPCCDQ